MTPPSPSDPNRSDNVLDALRGLDRLVRFQGTKHSEGKRSRFGLLLVISTLGYFAVVLAVWGAIALAGDRQWWATLITFGPRWILLVPLAILLLADWVFRRWLTWINLVSLTCILVPIMGYVLPSPWGASDEGAGRVRVLTCNVRTLDTTRMQLNALVQLERADLVAVQEAKSAHGWAPAWPDDWYHARRGGLAIGSRWPIILCVEHVRSYPDIRWKPINAIYCIIDSPYGPMGVCSVHMSTPRWGLKALLDRKQGINPQRSDALVEIIEVRRREAAELTAWLEQFIEPKIIAGDLNMPVDSAIYGATWAEYQNAFSEAGWGFGYTMRERVTPFLPIRMRIDHILTERPIRPIDAYVTSDIGSDHLPLMAILAVPPMTGSADSPEGKLPAYLQTPDESDNAVERSPLLED